MGIADERNVGDDSVALREFLEPRLIKRKNVVVEYEHRDARIILQEILDLFDHLVDRMPAYIAPRHMAASFIDLDYLVIQAICAPEGAAP